ncbi:MAG: BamA/TamA family outer membrane protein, partial [Chitinophagales bacterium]
MQDTLLSASLQVKKGRQIRFKQPEVRGTLQLNAHYLSQYSGIKEGGLYNEKLLEELDDALRELPFCNLIKPSQIEFSGENAQVVSFLDSRNASKFDLVIGVLPNNAITGRLLITGDGNLKLYNVFNAGELFDLHFTQLESATKELQTAFMYPYLPALPLGIDLGFSLFLRDSTFLERNALAGILFRFRGNNYVKAFTDFYNSDILKVDTAFVLATQSLPENVDINTTSYGAGMHYENLNYIYNPRSGIFIELEGAAGIKEIKQNAAILELTDAANPEYNFASVYDSVDLQTLAINYKFNLQYYFPLFRQSTIRTALAGAALINDKIFTNELFRIGGNKLLRGFDEQSVTASTYYIFTLEYRYLLSVNSFMQIFTDVGYTLNKSVTPYTEDFPVGFGAG